MSTYIKNQVVLNPTTRRSRKSFYGRAHVIELSNGGKLLKSYDTLVAYITKGKRFNRLWDGYSRTTMNHVNEFTSQYMGEDAPYFCKREWEKTEVKPLKIKIFM